MTADKKIKDYILKGIEEETVNAQADSFWADLHSTGTTLWLDTGDIDEALQVWSAEMEALTTNNTLINKVIQKGIYDDFIPRTQEILDSMPRDKKIMETAFILNARHGLRLTRKFGGFVSVELHTSTAHDIDAIVNYGLRYRDICPEKFIIKVPYTAAGLIGARLLKEKGVRINFTLGFSARQNIMAACISRPDYLNVFLGRIGAYIVDNKIGEGTGAAEKTVIETQKYINAIRSELGTETRLIAASIRHHDQLDMLAGVDVFTMPPKVAGMGRRELDGNFKSRLEEDYDHGLSFDPHNEAMEKFWEVDPGLLALAYDLGNKLPESGQQLEDIMRNEGYEDMFPILSPEERQRISEDGKIPVRSAWLDKISTGKIAPDTLLNLAGLASFTTDQAELDNRIDSIIS
ncbi:MAG: transaldolase family protein [Bacteroidales bacterium]|jgi:transaldolase|nr:transaldolase family protein [Bacteroidales bacterium]